MLRSKIIGTGSYLPPKELTNSELELMVDTSNEWILQRTGISCRRIADLTTTASDLAYEASKNALAMAGLKASDIDLIITATISGDMPLPSTACVLQQKLGARSVGAFDLNAACSGFIYALSIADSFIKTAKYRRILIVGTEVLSKFTDWQDRTTCVIFGDGAGAAILEATDEDRGVMSTHLYADGSLWELIQIPAGGSRLPCSENTVKGRQHYIKMKGNETFKSAVKALGNVVIETLQANNISASELSLLIPHQANMRIIQAIAERLALPMDRVYVNINKYGNTSAASIPIALDEAVRIGRVKVNDYIMLEAFGAGLTWASALIKW